MNKSQEYALNQITTHAKLAKYEKAKLNYLRELLTTGIKERLIELETAVDVAKREMELYRD